MAAASVCACACGDIYARAHVVYTCTCTCTQVRVRAEAYFGSMEEAEAQRALLERADDFARRVAGAYFARLAVRISCERHSSHLIYFIRSIMSTSLISRRRRSRQRRKR